METIEYRIADIEDLAFSCMPFIKNGGVFFKGQYGLLLGTYVTVSLKLIDDPTPLVFEGKVVWITPKGEQNQMPEGVGIQFAEENAERVRNAIESLMPDAFAADRNTSFL